MTAERTPVLWLTGAPGVGKTAVAWELFTQLTGAGLSVGYVDIDQLGICYPDSDDDPGRHRLKSRNLGSVVDGFRARGAECVVVSGVVDVDHGPYTDELAQTELTVCLLGADHDELRERFVDRDGRHNVVPEVLAEADQLAAGDITEFRVDTTGRPVSEVVRLVRERIGNWPGPATSRTSRHPEPAPVAADGSVLWICGATGVGKSTVAFDVYLRTARPGSTAAYIDLEQIGFAAPMADDLAGHRLRATNLAALWRNYHGIGAHLLVITGPVEDENALKLYAAALPEATFTVCRLHAGSAALTERIRQRRTGGSWHQPGDPLRGQPVSYLRRVAESAVVEAEALERIELGDLRIDTDGVESGAVADRVIARTGWPA